MYSVSCSKEPSVSTKQNWWGAGARTLRPAEGVFGVHLWILVCPVCLITFDCYGLVLWDLQPLTGSDGVVICCCIVVFDQLNPRLQRRFTSSSSSSKHPMLKESAIAMEYSVNENHSWRAKERKQGRRGGVRLRLRKQRLTRFPLPSLILGNLQSLRIRWMNSREMSVFFRITGIVVLWHVLSLGLRSGTWTVICP